MLDWLIVGGGIHGTHLSMVLREAGVREAAIRVLDPWEEPLDRWTTLTGRTGMSFLRSPGVHHIGLDPYDLFRFAGRRRARARRYYHGRYRRPSLELFQAHARDRISETGVADLRVRGQAQGLDRIRSGYRIDTEQGGIEARRVVLSLGAPAPAPEPPWSRQLRDGGVPVRHLFELEAGVDRLLQSPPGRDASVAVLGGGISAAQVALRLLREGRRVVLVSRHGLRIQAFDSAPGWLGPKYLREFHRRRCPRERREQIQAARSGGSIPEEVAGALRAAAVRGEITLCTGVVVGVDCLQPGRGILHLTQGHHGSHRVEVQAVLLATGWDNAPPGTPWLPRAADALGLRTAPCGHPIPDPGLRWASGLYVMGALAELEVGPVSRNIAGARIAAARIGEGAADPP